MSKDKYATKEEINYILIYILIIIVGLGTAIVLATNNLNDKIPYQLCHNETNEKWITFDTITSQYFDNETIIIDYSCSEEVDTHITNSKDYVYLEVPTYFFAVSKSWKSESEWCNKYNIYTDLYTYEVNSSCYRQYSRNVTCSITTQKEVCELIVPNKKYE